MIQFVSPLTKSAITLLFLASFASAQEWPQFRGPDGNGVVDSIKHPLRWSNDENVAWSVDIQGSALSSPLVIKDKILLTNAAGPMTQVGFMEGVRNMRSTLPSEPLDFEIVCLNLRDGSRAWTKSLVTGMPKYGIHRSNSYATASPVTDGKQIFAYFASIGLVAAVDLEGNEIWRKDVGAYPTGNGFGPGSSLAIYEDHIYLQCDNDQQSFVVALNKTNGEEAWRKSRSTGTSWATPLVWKNKTRTELVACGSKFVTSYDPKTGDENWTLNGIDSGFSGSPAADDERIYFGTSGPRSNGPLISVNTQMKGEQQFQSNTAFEGLAWSKMQAGPGMQSPVSVAGLVFVPGRGQLRCYSAADGSEVYKTRINGMKSGAASLWADEERLFILDEDGQTFVIKVGSEYELLGKNQIEDLFWSTPSIAGDALLLRSANKLYCIRKQNKQTN